MTDSLPALAGFARVLVLDCGARLREKRTKNDFSIWKKTGHNDIVTEHDLWAQKFLSGQILSRYPDHGILGEEETARLSSSPWRWVIDPIDGTTNYCQFGRGYAISLALLRIGRPVYGFVLDVERGKLFEGGSSETPAGQTSGEPPEEGILHIGFQTMRDFSLLGADPYALAECFRGVRYRGCASLELCGIGEEHAGFYVNSHLKLWDFAAAYPILRSRGCHVFACELSENRYFVCGFRSMELYCQCEPFFPEQVRRKLNKNGGDPFHAAN